MQRNIAFATLALLATACSSRSQIGLHYRLDGIAPSDVVRVETVVAVDPSDTRQFFADQPYRSVATGIGYEVRDLDGSKQRRMLITFDATIGYKFTPRFEFTLLPPDGEVAPPLIVTAKAYGNTNDIIGVIQPIKTKFPGVVDLDLKDARCSGQACSGSTQACCTGVCAETATDIANCGACGNACGTSGDTCTGQHCRCVGASGCTGGAACCAGLGCIDFKTDAFNCGACGHVCNPGEVCTGGACTCDGKAACTGGDAVCCAGGCSSVGCACPTTLCDAPKTCCGGSNCVALATDDQNCGACGRACGAGLTCAAGECTCNGIVCSNADTCCPTGCHALKDDPKNCGACGNACAAGELCVDGQCHCGMTTCAAGNSCCNGQCTATESDTQNCGACGNACQPGEQCASSACFCTMDPMGGLVTCLGNQTCCSGGCFDLSSDSMHCGTCTMGCSSGYACMMGACVQTTCVPACSQKNQCVGTACLCNGGPPCAAPKECCTSGCANLATDGANCGTCGKVCNAGETCVAGSCLRPDGALCTASNQCLNGHCVDGYCCDTACDVACLACNVPGKLGTCSNVPRDTLDPRMKCMITTTKSCGENGRCDGSGACEKWSGIACNTTCDPTGNKMTQSFCNGMGVCKPGAPVSCAPYVCDGNAGACFTTCMTAAQCVPAVCAGPSSVAQAVCMTPGPSTIGRCVVGVNDCGAYKCEPPSGSNPAFCASGQCNSGCNDNNVCAPNCGCHINLLNCLLGQVCTCP